MDAVLAQGRNDLAWGFRSGLDQPHFYREVKLNAAPSSQPSVMVA